FDPHIHAARAGIQGRADRRLAGRVDDVDVGAEQLGKGAEMMDPVGFDDGRCHSGPVFPAASSDLCSASIASAFSQCAVTMTPSSFASFMAAKRSSSE